MSLEPKHTTVSLAKAPPEPKHEAARPFDARTADAKAYAKAKAALLANDQIPLSQRLPRVRHP